MSNGQSYDHMEIAGLQLAARQLEMEFVGRYIHDPTNLARIKEIIENTARQLKDMEAQLMPGCPDGWVHFRCRCVPDYIMILNQDPGEPLG